MEAGTFYPDHYHILVCLLLVFCKLHNWSVWSFFIWQIPRGGNCLLLPVTGYAHNSFVFPMVKELKNRPRDARVKVENMWFLFYGTPCISKVDYMYLPIRGWMRKARLLLSTFICMLVHHCLSLVKVICTACNVTLTYSRRWCVEFSADYRYHGDAIVLPHYVRFRYRFIGLAYIFSIASLLFFIGVGLCHAVRLTAM